jgi:CheY-like chemotaxis protein
MPRKILVADDSLTIQKVVELTFSDPAYQLTCVANGRLALERVRDDPPDLILADVVMPEKNGYEVCEAIKRDPATAGIPVVLLAGTFEPFDRERAERLGCDAIVSKPFDSHQLFRKVEELLGGRVPPSAAAPAAAASPAGARPEPSRETPVFTRVPPSPFGGGFNEEDFTGSIRNLRSRAPAEGLEGLYGPEDVETALAAFHEVEPAAAPPARERDTPVVPRTEAGEATPAWDQGRTQRIDVSAYRAPRSTDPIAAPAPPAPAAAPASDVGDDTTPTGRVVKEFAARSARHPGEEMESPAVSAPHPEPLPGGEREAPAGVRELTDSDIERLAERVAIKVVERLSDRVVREIAWEVVPEMAELVVRERIRELESGSE